MKSPIKHSLKTEIWPILLLILTIGISYWAYPQLPDKVITHWNFYGQADGWGSRTFQSIFFPSLLVLMYLFFNILPNFDPKKERYEEFSGAYLIIRNLIISTLTIVFISTTLANLGYSINIGAITAGAVGIMMIALGNYFGKLKRNWFVGIKSPWTLSSENVWNKTHRLAGKLFMIWGLGIAIAPWINQYLAMGILFGGIVILLIIINVYSYRLFKKEKDLVK